ncbi:Receptor kinase TMK4 [Spatholobus suberectus]|nr:Receptor kinase TMK4 [Spatholobus suberectus]
MIPLLTTRLCSSLLPRQPTATQAAEPPLDDDFKVSNLSFFALPEQLKNNLLHTTCGTPSYSAREILGNLHGRGSPEPNADGVVGQQPLQLDGREVQGDQRLIESRLNRPGFPVTERNPPSESELPLPTHLPSISRTTLSPVRLPSLANLSMLETVFLDANNFTSVPAGCFLGLTSLKTLSMTDNINLAPWTIPTELTQSPYLVELDLGNANLVGTLPDVFDSFVSLQELRLSYNNLTGGLPKSFAGSEIRHLWLNTQKDGFGFSGSIEVLSSMTHLSQLHDNILTGVVPPSLMSLPSLKNVSLDYNWLQGPVPSFGKGVKVTLDGNNFCQKPCDSQITTLLDIAADFGYPHYWTGNDPCQDWRYIVCSDGKVITVNLAKRNLTGTISPAFANLTDLRNLYLNDNNLIGLIPGSLTNLSQLWVLDVSNNNLSGEIPKFSTKVKFSASGNVWLERSASGRGSGTTPSTAVKPPSGSLNVTSSGSSLSPAWIAGVAIVAVFFIAMVLYVFRMCHVKNWRCKFGRVDNLENGKEGVPSFEVASVTMSIQVLRQVTNNFSEDNILGRGGFGVVYKGEFHDGSKIAVKRMQSGATGSQGMNEFQAEIACLSKVRHRHLVGLLGHCINVSERLLVYEYMPQGTLTQHLFYWRENGRAPLTWKQRTAIALDVARGVEYLHSLAQQSFIHRDLKPSNILLGDDMRAKVADFGLVKNIAPDGKDSVETRVAGTFGYLAPEYAATGRVTTKVDVYAFGVVLMELITGKKALDNTVPDEMCHLVSWFRRILIDMENISMATDQTLNPDEETMESIYKVAELAGHCTAPEPHQRPNMGRVVNVLVPLVVEQWKPTTSHEEEEGYDMIYEGTYDMSFSEILSGR